MYCLPKFSRIALPVMLLGLIVVVPSGTADAETPIVYAYPDHFEFTVQSDGSVQNAGMVVLEESGMSAPFSAETKNNSAWLQIVPPDSLDPQWMTPDSLNFDVVMTGYAIGDYADTILIYPESIPFEPVSVPVSVTVEGFPTISVSISPGFLSFELPTGGYIANNSVFVYEESGGTVPFLSGTLQQSSWLILQDTINPYHYTPDSLYFSIDATGLEPGVYVDSIAVGEVPNEIIRFDMAYAAVMLTVTGDAAEFVVETVPTSFEVTLSYGEFTVDSLFVYEMVGRLVPFVFDNSEYWVVVNPLGMSPYYTPEMLTVVIDTDTLSAGVHTDSIWIYPSTRAMAFVPVSVPVTMTIVPSYSCGDTDGSGEVDIDDIVGLISYVFSGGEAYLQPGSGDADCDGTVDIDDVVALVKYIFSGEQLPCFECT